MILPDGSLFGVTEGARADRMDFCIACHIAAGEINDQLFFVPEESRIELLEPRNLLN